ncbi:MAG: hypothetical protein EXR77_15175 [Myxococcales bacterium]|nr:hypothetical protein [Myxococcales bacterium]
MPPSGKQREPRRDDQGTLSPSRLTDSRLTDSRLTDSRLTDSRLTDSRLTDSRLTDSRLTDSRLTDSLLSARRALRLADQYRLDRRRARCRACEPCVQKAS